LARFLVIAENRFLRPAARNPEITARISMALLQIKEVSLHFGSAPILDGVNYCLQEGDRVCLMGRNGSGKSSLLRLIAGEETPDSGTIFCSPGSVMTRLTQDIPDGVEGTVLSVMRSGISDLRQEEDWEVDHRLAVLAEEMQLPEDAPFASLSGGMKRRALLGRALAGQPDLLLLDEPTNHLDIDAILWMEEFFLSHSTTLLFVTHDRAFLRKLATRIVEIDRGSLQGWDCDYETFLERRAEVLQAEEKQQKTFDKKLAQEEAWLRQGVKARRTRNEGRVRALKALRTERSKRRDRQGKARIGLQEGGASGQRVLTADHLNFQYPKSEVPVIADFSIEIWKGDKIGFLGPNGCGKTTLLQLLLGRLQPVSGSLRIGTNLEVVYLDQLRDQLNDEKSLAENVAGPAETVRFQGQDRHIHSYLRDFLFPSDRIRQPVKFLSGGERNRLLLAKLFLQPANLLVLDEPTNDLDAETLELLEEILVSYQGTLLLVSHDREFLDNTVSSLVVFEGNGVFQEVPGGYSDWLRWKNQAAATVSKAEAESGESAASPQRQGQRPRKFLIRERRELEELPQVIQHLESKQEKLAAQLQDPAIYRDDPDRLPELEQELKKLEETIATTFRRWEELELLRESLEG